MNPYIVRNSAKCLECDDEIESKRRHDFVTCKCGNISVDGGKDYLRRSYKKLETYEDTSITRSHQEAKELYERDPASCPINMPDSN